ncbi:DcaP family trimeric outer membrane transporter [Algiphilus aromaticivorans]|jgi:hypothetical protein|uniref:DcaP family trimeric outer membrane transporter n=1 Tax=Algiphilus aromaticivorans TaxID=382454 RepID=UPI0005C1F1A8|nr:DcaP family trimeric outer membrane transporter [Algiphilus aromaticivorans]
MRSSNRLYAAGFGAACLLVAGPAAAVSTTIGDTEVSLGGYIKLDAMYSSYSDAAGGNAPEDRGRTFTIPALIPVESAGSDRDGATDFTARESRFNLGTSTSKGGHTLKTFIELDFLDPAFDGGLGGNERLVNDSNPRLRHAFVSWETPMGGSWLFGQTWSTFMDLGAYPELLDFIGPSEGMTFVRQAQVRYTNGPLQIALENPQSTITPTGGGRISNDNENLPDAVVKYSLKTQSGNLLSFSGLLRQLDGGGPGASGDKTVGYGVNISGKQMLGANDIRFQVNYGDGIGRYLGLNTANGAVIDNDGELESIEAFGGYVSYRQVWSARWRSNLSYGYFSADNDAALTGNGVTKQAQSLNLNLLHEPVAGLVVGGELIYSDRELESGADGSLSRFQFSAKYAF